MNIEDQLISFSSIFENEINEKILLDKAIKARAELRLAYVNDRSLFSSESIIKLKELSNKIEMIEIFIDHQDDFDHIQCKEDIDEIILELYCVVETLSELKVSGRINKEIRGLLNKKDVLPSKAVTLKKTKENSAYKALSANPHKCKKCDEIMVLREGGGTFFWGCRTFPTCWGKRYLTKDELSLFE